MRATIELDMQTNVALTDTSVTLRHPITLGGFEEDGEMTAM